MPSKSDHLSKTEHNKGVMDYLLQRDPPCADWVVTVAFYRALHLVDALLAEDHKHDGPRHPHDHRSRERLLKATNRYKTIYKHYLPLKNASIIARYLSTSGGKPYSTFADYMTLENVRSEIIGHRLQQIVKSVNRLLGKTRTRRY